MNNSKLYNLTDQEKVLEPLALSLAAGFSEAARSALHSSAMAACISIEPTPLRTLLKAAVTGMETRFDSGISGCVLLVMVQTDLARLGGLLSGRERTEDTAIAPETLDACLKFFAGGLEAAGKSFAQSCGLAIHATAPTPVPPDGHNDALLTLADSYSSAIGLTLQLRVESHPDSQIRLLVHSDLLASLNAQLPHYETSAASGVLPGGANGSGKKPQARWNIDLILDVELEVAVSFGETQLPLRDILKLGVGSVIELEKGVNDPVTVLVNEKPIARGEVVMVDGNYGVKVLEVESTADRIRSLG
ncbi:MAG: flagellar motor switch protein FliN [Acidobacteriia bacterium]|nr:flagellar motor switch protein FliN [Terriglobia bacterium]